MADSKITQLDENTAPAAADLLAIVDDPAGTAATQKITVGNLFKVIGLGDDSELTISSGSITVTQSFHTVDTESDAASDDLDTISGGATGDILIIRPNSTDRTVVAKDGTDNLRLAGDFTMQSNQDTLTLIRASSSVWFEISRSDNGG